MGVRRAAPSGAAFGGATIVQAGSLGSGLGVLEYFAQPAERGLGRRSAPIPTVAASLRRDAGRYNHSYGKIVLRMSRSRVNGREKWPSSG